MEKKTIVDQVEMKRDGTMQIRFRKILEEDDGSITELGYHRTAVMPGDDVDAQLEVVDNHLRGHLKAGGLAKEEKDFINEMKDSMWTPARIAAKKQALAKQMADITPTPEPVAAKQRQAKK